MVDDLSILDPDTGEFVEKEWDDAAILRLRTLVQDAVGYDVSRGDSINVINSTFREIAEVEVLTAFY